MANPKQTQALDKRLRELRDAVLEEAALCVERVMIHSPKYDRELVAGSVRAQVYAALPNNVRAALAITGADAGENLADYLLRNQPPTWDYKTILRLAREVATGGMRADRYVAAQRQLIASSEEGK